MPTTDSYLEIDESSPEYAIDKLTPESEAATRLWEKHFTRYVSRAKFWRPRLDIAKQCARAEGRNILTDAQRQKYYDEDKWPIEPQEMRPIIATLERMIEKAIPGTDVTFEDETPPPNAASPDIIKTVISWIKHKLKLKKMRNETLHKGLIVGFPQCVWASKIRGAPVVPGMLPLRISLRPWDSVLPEEYYSSETGEDIRDVIFINPISKKELYQTYPDRVGMHKRHEAQFKSDPGYRQRFENPGASDTSVDRSDLIFNMVSEARFNSEFGRYFAIEAVFPIVKKRKAWVNTETLAIIPVPPDWDEARRSKWLEYNPDFTETDDIDVETLWVTTITSDGFVWENQEHWFQKNGALPAAWYIADTVDNQPMGLGEDLLPYILLKTACKIEGLSQVRKGTGRLTAIAEGAVKNAQHLNRELSKEEGVAIIKKGHTVNDAIKSFERKPNTTFFDYEDRIGQEMQAVHRISGAVMGDTINRQSQDAKLLQAEMSLTPQSRYVDNFYSFNIQLENLICQLIPLVLNDQQVIQIKDEWGQAQEPVTVNQKQWVGWDTEAQIIANDLTSATYRVEAVVSDDSLASRENQMRDFMELLAAIGNQLFKLDPLFLGQTFSLFPNRFAREASKFLMQYGERQQAQQAQQAQLEAQVDQSKVDSRKFIELEKLRRPKVAFKLSPEDIKNSPDGAKLMYEWMRTLERESQNEERLAPQQGTDMEPGVESGIEEEQVTTERPNEEMAAAI
jgi:hypothetical protein